MMQFNFHDPSLVLKNAKEEQINYSHPVNAKCLDSDGDLATMIIEKERRYAYVHSFIVSLIHLCIPLCRRLLLVSITDCVGL